MNKDKLPSLGDAEWNARIVRRYYRNNTAGDKCDVGDVVAVKLEKLGWTLCQVLSKGVSGNTTAIYAVVKRIKDLDKKNAPIWTVIHNENLKLSVNTIAYRLGDVLTVQGICPSEGRIDKPLPVAQLKQLFEEQQNSPKIDPNMSSTVTMNGLSKAMVIAIYEDSNSGQFELIACTTGGRIITIDKDKQITGHLGNFYDRPFDHISFTKFFEPNRDYYRHLEQVVHAQSPEQG